MSDYDDRMASCSDYTDSCSDTDSSRAASVIMETDERALSAASYSSPSSRCSSQSCPSDSPDPPKSTAKPALRRRAASFVVSADVPLRARSRSRERDDLSTLDAPITKAVRDCDLSKVKHYIQAGYNINKLDSAGRTLLMVACEKEKGLPLVQYLLNAGARISIQGTKGTTCLLLGCVHGRTPQVAAVLEQPDRGTVVNKCDVEGRSPLFAAAANGFTEIAELLLSCGANPDQVSDGGDTPMTMAAANGHLNIVNALLRCDVTVDLPFKDGRTPLMLAAYQSGNKDTVSRLLAAGANGALTDNKGRTAIHFGASSSAADAALLQLLLDYIGCHLLKKQDNKGNTPLHNAAIAASTQKVGLLLRYGSIATVYNLSGRTALHEGAIGGHPGVVQQLVRYGGSALVEQLVNENSKKHIFELASPKVQPVLNPQYLSIFAAVEGGSDMVQRVIETFPGSDQQLTICMNAQDQQGTTPLLRAIFNNDATTLRLLCKHKATVNQSNKYGLGGLFWCNWLSRTQCKSVLTDHSIRSMTSTEETAITLLEAALKEPYLGASSVLKMAPPKGLFNETNIFQQQQLQQQQQQSKSGLQGRMEDGIDTQSTVNEQQLHFDRTKDWGKLFDLEKWLLELPSSGILGSSEVVSLVQRVKYFVINTIGAGNNRDDGLKWPYIFALHVYTDSSVDIYRQMNTALRTLSKSAIQCWEPLIHFVDYALHQLKPISSNGFVYRGISCQIDHKAYQKGATLCWTAFSSTSRKPDVAIDFFNHQLQMQGIVFVIQCSSAKCIQQYSAFPEEAEWLFRPGAEFVVERITEYNPGQFKAAEWIASGKIPWGGSLATHEAFEKETLVVYLTEKALKQ